MTVGFKGSETAGIKARWQQYEDENEDEDEGRRGAGSSHVSGR